MNRIRREHPILKLALPVATFAPGVPEKTGRTGWIGLSLPGRQRFFSRRLLWAHGRRVPIRWMEAGRFVIEVCPTAVH